MPDRSNHGLVAIVASVMLALASGGCYSGSLATSTGPLRGGTWSIDKEQQAHVGETVKFSFVLTRPLLNESVSALGLADYCMFDFGDEIESASVNSDGGFQSEYTFRNVSDGQKVQVIATAYRMIGDRDRMKIAGQWVENISPVNEPDDVVARASVVLEFYQSEVSLYLPPSADDYDFGTGRLTLHGAGGAMSIRFVDKPQRAGFRVEPAQDGGWHIRYHPAGDEIDPGAQTLVEFSVFDQVGREHTLRDKLDTP